MIDQQQQIDHDEHAAVTAEAEAEHAAEQAHLDYVAALAAELRDTGRDAHTAGADSVARLLDEVALRLSPNVHRYELLMRQQHTALLCAVAAEVAEVERSYGVLAAVEAAVEGYVITHNTAGDGEARRALLGAADLVKAIARRAASLAPSEAPTVAGRAGR